MNTNSSAVIIPAPSSATNGVGTNASAGDIRDIKAPVEIPSGWFWLWSVLGALAVAAVSYFALRFWRRHRASPAALQAVLPPHERARRKLQQALGIIYQPRPFCILVSDTLRLYLEEAFSLHAPERTTEEFLDELQASPSLSLAQKQLLGDFLMRCDLVKFARHEPSVEQLQELHQSALRLIDETSVLPPRPVPSTSPAPPSPASTEPSPSPVAPIANGAAPEEASSIAHRPSSAP